MIEAGTLREVVPGPVRRFPADLAACVAIALITPLAAHVPGVRGTPVQFLLGAPFVLFVPGYVVVAALFPEAAGEDADALPRRGRRVTPFERAVLSVGASVVVVPLVGLLLNFGPWRLTRASVLAAVAGFSVVVAAIAAVRRWAVPPDGRFRVPYDRWYDSVRAELFGADTRIERALNAVLVVALLLAAVSVAYAVGAPDRGETYTEFYLLAENESGALAADGYPTEFRRGEARPLVVGVANHEGHPVNYTVLVRVQRVAIRNDSARVLNQRRLARFERLVAAGETWHRDHRIEPTTVGSGLRLQYLLYRGSPPPDPSGANAYHEAHYWINVTAGPAD